MAPSSDDPSTPQPDPRLPEHDDGGVDRLISPAALWLDAGEWARVRTVSPPVSRTLARVVLPFALIPPLMILYAGHDHPQAYRLASLSASWEWIALAVLLIELLTVYAEGRILHAAGPARVKPPSREQAYLVAALAAVPLWASAAVLAVPSVAALVVGQLLGHAAALRALYRGCRALYRIDAEVEALHLAYMAHSVAVVAWLVFFALALLSLS